MSVPAGPPLRVVTDMAEAARRLAAGERVVAVVRPEEAGRVGGLIRDAGGRAPVVVGDPADPATTAAAAEMAAELGARQASDHPAAAG